MTKKEIILKLEEKEIEFDKRQTKDELQELLDNFVENEIEEKKEDETFEPIYSGIKIVAGQYQTTDGTLFNSCLEAAKYQGGL